MKRGWIGFVLAVFLCLAAWFVSRGRRPQSPTTTTFPHQAERAVKDAGVRPAPRSADTMDRKIDSEGVSSTEFSAGRGASDYRGSAAVQVVQLCEDVVRWCKRTDIPNIASRLLDSTSPADKASGWILRLQLAQDEQGADAVLREVLVSSDLEVLLLVLAWLRQSPPYSRYAKGFRESLVSRGVGIDNPQLRELLKNGDSSYGKAALDVIAGDGVSHTELSWFRDLARNDDLASEVRRAVLLYSLDPASRDSSLEWVQDLASHSPRGGSSDILEEVEIYLLGLSTFVSTNLYISHSDVELACEVYTTNSTARLLALVNCALHSTNITVGPGTTDAVATYCQSYRYIPLSVEEEMDMRQILIALESLQMRENAPAVDEETLFSD